MTAYFKGFEKTDSGETVAVVNFPDALKHTPYFQADGSIETKITPFPHEERLGEAAFGKKFAGLGFDAVRDLPFRGDGHNLDPILERHIQQAAPQFAPGAPYSKPSPNR